LGGFADSDFFFYSMLFTPGLLHLDLNLVMFSWVSLGAIWVAQSHVQVMWSHVKVTATNLLFLLWNCVMIRQWKKEISPRRREHLVNEEGSRSR